MHKTQGLNQYQIGFPPTPYNFMKIVLIQIVKIYTFNVLVHGQNILLWFIRGNMKPTKPLGLFYWDSLACQKSKVCNYILDLKSLTIKFLIFWPCIINGAYHCMHCTVVAWETLRQASSILKITLTFSSIGLSDA